jgi:hypothetical protein
MKSVRLGKLQQIRKGNPDITAIRALADLPGFNTCCICDGRADQRLSVTTETTHTREQHGGGGYGTIAGLCRKCAELL